MTVAMVTGSPEGFRMFEQFLEDFEKAGPGRYERREKPNELTMLFFYRPDAEIRMEQLRLMTSRIEEIFITITTNKQVTLFYEGKVKVYPVGA